jgi:hypothetical protein
MDREISDWLERLGPAFLHREYALSSLMRRRFRLGERLQRWNASFIDAGDFHEQTLACSITLRSPGLAQVAAFARASSK